MMRQPTALLRWLLLVVAAIIHVDSFTCQIPNHSPSVGSHLHFCWKNFHHQQENTMNSDDFAQHYDRFRKFRTAPHHAQHIRRILLLSDLHTDYPANQDWLYNLCTSSDDDGDAASLLDSQTMILIAGDVSHDLDIVRWTFRTLKKKFGEVIFTPGNHDLWIDKERTRIKVATTLDADDDIASSTRRRCRTSGKGDGCTTSIEKLEKLFQLCIEEGIRIGPVRVGNSSLWVIPLLSWHHFSFDTEPPIECWGGIPSARKVVADYRKTVWPHPISSLDDSVAQFMDGLNDVILDLDGIEIEDDAPILTFSHFLPRIELIPEKRYLILPTLHSCVGSVFVETRLRQLGNGSNKNGSGGADNNHLHAFGHSHLAWDATIDGVRYVHVPLAYPREWEQRRGSLEIGSMKGEESHNRFPVCIWENNALGDGNTGKDDNKGSASSTGFPSQWLGGWWSKYYMVMPRQPHRNKELAPWAAKRFRQLPGGRIESFTHAEVADKIGLLTKYLYTL